MSFNEFATEIESQTGSCDLTGARIFCPYEAPKNSYLLLSRYTDASISNGEERFVRLDHKAEIREWERRIGVIETAVRGIASVQCERIVPSGPAWHPFGIDAGEREAGSVV